MSVIMDTYNKMEVDNDDYMSVTEARELAVHAHGEHLDKDGSFHIHHVSRVAERCNEQHDSYQRVAWLHDVIGDTSITIEDLEGKLPEKELNALELLTRQEGESYMDYIRGIASAAGAAGAIARAVKRADLKDNLIRCINSRTTTSKSLIRRYGEALEIIERRDGYNYNNHNGHLE
jgi:hypothetical protein